MQGALAIVDKASGLFACGHVMQALAARAATALRKSERPRVHDFAHVHDPHRRMPGVRAAPERHAEPHAGHQSRITAKGGDCAVARYDK